MPELPEVEVTRLGLIEPVTNRRIESVRLGKPLRWPLGIEPSALVGRKIQAIQRRSKYLIFQLDTGVLLIHLGMSGSLMLVERDSDQLLPYEHFGVGLGQKYLILRDPRRFGAVVWSAAVTELPASRLLGTIGREPLDAATTADWFWRCLKQRRTEIKQDLLAGKIICGVGNIYASEALFAAGIRPTRRSNKVSRAEAAQLLLSIRRVLMTAIDAGGSSLKDFRASDGELGQFQTQTKVYGRAGQPCLSCGRAIRTLVQAQRSTYFCPQCQKR